jgi:hypothetical protein
MLQQIESLLHGRQLGPHVCPLGQNIVPGPPHPRKQVPLQQMAGNVVLAVQSSQNGPHLRLSVRGSWTHVPVGWGW